MIAEAKDDLEEMREAAIYSYRRLRCMGHDLASAAALGQYVAFSYAMGAELDPEVAATGKAMLASLEATAESLAKAMA